MQEKVYYFNHHPQISDAIGDTKILNKTYLFFEQLKKKTASS